VRTSEFAIGQLFEVHSGDFHAVKELDAGKFPLVSCGDTNNGVMGYYDIPPEFLYRDTVTVAYNGSWPLMAKFHPYEFGAKDDVAVLKPLQDQDEAFCVYVAALLNRMTWRYSYGRKCFKQKLESVEIPLPVTLEEVVDLEMIHQIYREALEGVLGDADRNLRSWKARINK
jgi:type I restriction enzyme M protein